MLAGLALAICGTVLPYTLFAGETQADVLMETYLTIPAGVLIATGLVKAMLTPALINLGWRGGHFFPVIFSGVSLGYGLAILTGADPVFCVAVCTASTMGAVMRQPVMVVGLLLMCFPLKGIRLHDHRGRHRRRYPTAQAAAQVARLIASRLQRGTR